jgi:hypothetical protein
MVPAPVSSTTDLPFGPALAVVPTPAPAPSLAPSRTFVLVVAGLGGDPQHREHFRATALRIADGLSTQHGIPRADIAVLTEDKQSPPGVAGPSTQTELLHRLASIAREAGPDDRLLIILIGHGSGRGHESRVSLPGPDITAAGLAAALLPFEDRTVAIVNTASASGDFASVLAGPHRIIITATASPTERNETTFADRFADAIAEGGADTDKDGLLSLLEAYTYAHREVTRAYEKDNRLLTEHARLEDDGDGSGAADPGASNGDGALAKAFTFGGERAIARAAGDSMLVALLEQQKQLQQEIAALRARKNSMDSTDYEAQLESLLVRLAEVSSAARAREAKP